VFAGEQQQLESQLADAGPPAYLQRHTITAQLRQVFNVFYETSTGLLRVWHPRYRLREQAGHFASTSKPDTAAQGVHIDLKDLKADS
jgi:hypothetical protein